MGIIHVGAAFGKARDGAGNVFSCTADLQASCIFDNLNDGGVLFRNAHGVASIGECMLGDSNLSRKQRK